MTIVLDTGALIAIDEDRKRVLEFVEAARRTATPAVVPATMIAETWRGDHPRLSKFFKLVAAFPNLDVAAAKRAGILLAPQSSADFGIADANLVDVAISMKPSVIVTGNQTHVAVLLQNSGIPYVLDKPKSPTTQIIIKSLASL